VVQQGSFVAQMGTVTPVLIVPAGNQQQQPPQSIQVATCGSAPQLHAPPSPPASPAPASLFVLVEVLLLERLELLLLEPVGLPLLVLLEVRVVESLVVLVFAAVVVVLLEPLFVVLAADVLDPLDADPPSSFDVLSLLLQAARPTVDEAPMTTITWKSLSICMDEPLPRIASSGVSLLESKDVTGANVSESSHPRLLESTRARGRFTFLGPARGVPPP
jgi:hypothetical protein